MIEKPLVTNKPLVTVLLPVYNGQDYIIEAAESILKQDYANFELLLINDGSNDSTDSLIKQHLLHDERVRYYSRENKGLIATLNEGISLAKGDYLARMDADDISHSDRLSKQVLFLQEDPKVAVVGTAYDSIDQNGVFIRTRRPPCKDYLIKTIFVFGSPFAHPSVMINKKLTAADLYYDKAYIHAEDYELWLRLSLKYKLANLPSICLDYRVLEQSVSRQYEHQQKASVVKAQVTHLYDRDDSQLTERYARILLGFDVSGRWQKLCAFRYLSKHRKISFSLGLTFIYLLKRLRG